MPPSLPTRPSPRPEGEDLARWLKDEARALGFHRVAITEPAPSEAAMANYRRWLEAGHHGEMEWLARPEGVARRAEPALTLPGVRSVVVVTHRYPHEDPPGVPGDPRRGVIARYARGTDYHRVVVPRLEALHRRLEDRLGHAVDGRAYADTGPLLERDLASRAGLGWVGRNTLLLHPRAGSWELLGVLLLALDLPPDPPFPGEHCGTCNRCVDLCPTGALLGRDATGAPVMDARRCISYLTIELKGAIPRDLRPLVGNRVFGCDICQEVCPFNGPKHAAAWPAPEPAYAPGTLLDGPDLVELTARLLDMSGKEYLRTFQESPLARPRRQGMLRNLCVALGNSGRADAVPVLVRALSDRHPLVRKHAAWALGRLAGTEARAALEERREAEPVAAVREEIDAVLESR